MTDCSKCQRTDVKCCFTCKKDSGKCKVWHHCGSDCPEHESRMKTNADRIRAMSDEELAEWLAVIDHYWDDGECVVNFGDYHVHDSKDSILEWLQKEVEE